MVIFTALTPALPASGRGGRTQRPALTRRLPLQERAHVSLVHALGDERFADAAGQNERQFAALDLLVLAHRGQNRGGVGVEARNLLDSRRQPHRAQMRLDPRRILTGGEAEIAGEAERAGEADRDALAVDQPRPVVPGQRLEGMAESVPEIQQRARPLFRLVGCDDARLGGATDRHRAPPPLNTSRQCASSHSKKS